MCGIIGYVGQKPCVETLYTGLQKLSYRGYDSSGIAVLDFENIYLAKSEGKLERLRPYLSDLPQNASIGMGHTRWATHGVPSQENAHPHIVKGLALVHNGILENYQELKIELLQKGHNFCSETDSEVILHIIQDEIEKTSNIFQAIQNVVPRFKGAYAVGIMSTEEPDAIYIVKQGSPIALGFGNNENLFASDALPLVGYTNKIIFLEDGEIAKVRADSIKIWDFAGRETTRSPIELNWDAQAAEKGGYRHYMLKEIHEQPAVVRQTIERLIDFKNEAFHEEELCLDKINWSSIKRVVMVGCGTAYYAAQVGCYVLEPLLGIPITCELASEFRYRGPYLSSDTLVIPITQSGETADTLASVKYAKERGCQVFCICNVPHSSIPRHSDGTLYMKAGPEIGVASTKAFTSMLINIYLLGLAVYRRKGATTLDFMHRTLAAVKLLPAQMEQILQQENHIGTLACHYKEVANCLFIGRGASCPIAFEGALKLKEISYIHAEGYAGGELKHGPIALIDRNMPVIAIVPSDSFREKMLSNIEEIKAREGRVLGVGPVQDNALLRLCDHYISCPTNTDPLLQAILSAIPLQLFAYYVAFHRGTDVDQPRNLAKSVTVE